MKHVIIIGLLFCFPLFSQEKKIIYFNEIQQEISEKEFLKGKNSREFIDLYFENDSLKQALLIKREPTGRLNENDFKELKKNLAIETNINNELIVIIYYPGKDNCNSMEANSTWNIFDEDYLPRLKKISMISHHWIYKNDENLKYYYPEKIEWKKDKNQFIEKMFFKYSYRCSSLVVIDPQGNFKAFFGEFGKQKVWEISEEVKKSNKKRK